MNTEYKIKVYDTKVTYGYSNIHVRRIWKEKYEGLIVVVSPQKAQNMCCYFLVGVRTFVKSLLL